MLDALSLSFYQVAKLIRKPPERENDKAVA
jgi:hypothetical protein